MSQRLLLVVSAAVLVGAFIVGAKFYNQNTEAPKMSESQKERLVPAHAQTLGNPDANVVLVEFFDPACATCAQFSPLTKELVRKHDGQLKLVLRYAPFHENSKAVVAMLEASKAQGKFWEALTVLFEYQSSWVYNHKVYPERAWKILESVGIDVEALNQEMRSSRVQEVIAKDVADAKALGIAKTPSFFVNGAPLQEFGYEPLVDLIESAL
jgi:protein-disulfide isomerase